MDNKIVNYLLENGVKPDDLESIKVDLEKATTAEYEKAVAAQKHAEELRTAYEDLDLAWREYVSLLNPELDLRKADKVLYNAVKRVRPAEEPVVEKRGIKEIYDAAKGKREKREMTAKEIDDFINDFFGSWRIKF